MKFPAIYFVYAGLAVIVALALSFGIAYGMHSPPALTVELHKYQPIQPPAPAIPTVAPVNPQPQKPSGPAPAPVVVTTQPLPSITPEPTPSGLRCDVNSSGLANSQVCIMENSLPMIQQALQLMGVMLIVAGLMGLLYTFGYNGIYGGGRR